jgi:hypothetical protein
MNTHETTKQNVLRALALAKAQGYLLLNSVSYPAKDGWVPGHVLTHPAIGGEAGKRRKRDLEAEGWLIEKRKKRDSNGYEYRLFCDRHAAQRIAFSTTMNFIPKMIYGEKSYQLGVFQ